MAYEKRDISTSSGHPAIHLQLEGKLVYLDVSGGEDPHYIDCPVSLNDLETKHGDYLTAVGAPFRREPAVFDDEASDAPEAAATDPGNIARLQEIARLGRELLNALVPQNQQGRFFAALRPRPSQHPARTVRRVVELCPIAARLPWSLLYASDDLPERADDVRGFLGREFLFLGRRPRQSSSTILSRARDEKSTDVETVLAQVDASPMVGHIWDDQFLMQIQKEHWYVPSSIPREELDALTPDIPPATRTDRITRFVLTPRDRLHFDAHGVMKKSDPSRLDAFGVQTRMTEPRTSARAWSFVGTNGNLLITMNVCHAAASRLTGDDGFAAELRANGAAAVIAPWTVVAYPLAMQFMRVFHEAVCSGHDYLHAFDQAQMTTMPRNVAALAYLCIGDLNFLDGGLTPDAVRSLFSQDAA